MIKKILLTLLIFSFNITSSLQASNIAVLNIEKIINSNKEYKSILNKIEISQAEYMVDFEKKEKDIEKLLEEIEKSNLILNDDEMTILINNYNNKLEKFTNLVDSFNTHYQNQISAIRRKILDQIVILVKKYANDNKIDLIFDSTTYILASNNINITNLIKEELEKINLQLEFNNFAKE